MTADNSSAGVQALEVLGEMGPAAQPALPTLCQLLHEPRLELLGQRWGPPHRAAVIRTLGQVGPPAATAVPALIARLMDNFYIRMEVAVALVNIGPQAQHALITRDAVWGTSIALLAAAPPANLATLSLVETLTRTWVPRDAHTRKDVREAILQFDPTAAERVGALR
jgi:hypothetical protein